LLDVSGRIVRHLKTPQAAGRWSVDWDTRDDAGAALPAGLYFARLRSGTESTSVRFTIAR